MHSEMTAVSLKCSSPESLFTFIPFFFLSKLHEHTLEAFVGLPSPSRKNQRKQLYNTVYNCLSHITAVRSALPRCSILLLPLLYRDSQTTLGEKRNHMHFCSTHIVSCAFVSLHSIQSCNSSLFILKVLLFQHQTTLADIRLSTNPRQTCL